jgi:hypothetical protein
MSSSPSTAKNKTKNHPYIIHTYIYIYIYREREREREREINSFIEQRAINGTVLTTRTDLGKSSLLLIRQHFVVRFRKWDTQFDWLQLNFCLIWIWPDQLAVWLTEAQLLWLAETWVLATNVYSWGRVQLSGRIPTWYALDPEFNPQHAHTHTHTKHGGTLRPNLD